MTEAEVLDERAAKVGTLLAEVETEIRQLFGELNFVEIEPGSTLETDLTMLGHVRDLVSVAWELYPYPYEG